MRSVTTRAWLVGMCLLGALPGTVSGQRVVATDYPTLQAAVDALPSRMGEVYLPEGTYVLNATLDLTLDSGYGGGIKLTGAGKASRIVPKTHGQPAIDLTGASHCFLQDLSIDARTGTIAVAEAPNVGLLLARRSDGWAAQEHRFDRVTIEGYFTVANVYDLTSELNRFTGCTFVNTAPGGHNVVWTHENFAGVTSPYRGTPRNLYSTTEFRMIACSLCNRGGAGSANFYGIGFSMDVTVRDCRLIPSAGGDAVFLGTSSLGGPVRGVDFDGLCIAGENAAAVFRVEGRTESVTIRNSSLTYGTGPLLDAESLIRFTFENNDVQSVAGWNTAIEAGSLSDGLIRNNRFSFPRIGGQDPEPGEALILSAATVSGSWIQAPARADVSIANRIQTIIEALDEQGIRRRYLEDGDRGCTLNATPVDSAAVTNAQLGDVVLDDGSNTAGGDLGLMVYDGTDWVPMN